MILVDLSIFWDMHVVPTDVTRGFGYPLTRIISSCEPPFGLCEPNLGPLQEHQVFLTTETFISPCLYFFMLNYMYLSVSLEFMSAMCVGVVVTSEMARKSPGTGVTSSC